MQEKNPQKTRGFWRKLGEIFLFSLGILSCLAWFAVIAYWWYFQIIHPSINSNIPQTPGAQQIDHSLTRKIIITVICLVLCLPAARVLARKLHGEGPP